MITVYGIPTCSTVKRARDWLSAAGLPHRFHDFRAVPVSRERIASWVSALGSGPLRNTSGGSYRALGPEKKTWSEPTWIDAFTADPMLIRRPVVERDGTAVMAGFRGSDDALRALLG